MRYRFEKQLENLNAQMIQMGGLCEEAIAKAVRALLEGDVKLAKETIEEDEEIDDKEQEIQALCLKILLQQQPVARDLRQISSALKMLTDLERIGDQAADISGIVLSANIKDAESTAYVEEMAKATIKMVTDSIDAYVRKDLKMAQEVIDGDDVVDDLFEKVKQSLIKHITNKSGNGEYAIDLLMIAKYLERIGDHATNIAEWVEFSITGHKR